MVAHVLTQPVCNRTVKIPHPPLFRGLDIFYFYLKKEKKIGRIRCG